LVAVLGWPIGLGENTSLAGVELNRSKMLRPDRRVLRPKELPDQRVVAESAHPSARGNLVLSADAGRRHLHVLGPSGVGKSTLLSHLIVQDIEAGHGVVVVDPKGDLVDDTVTRLSTDSLKRVAVLDPSDQAPLGLNPIASASGGTRGVAVDGLLGVLHSLWASSWGPRLHDVLHAGLLTLALDDVEPGHSLVELPLLLTNPSFRRPLMARASGQDPLGLGGFWAWFDGLSDEQVAQVLGPVMNKLRAFILRPDLRAVLGQSQPRFSVQQVFTERRSLLVRLPKGELGGEAAALFGSLIVQQVWQATLARSAVPARSRHPVFVYLDEFQEVVRLPLDLGDALAQARGLGVGMVLAHQHLGQLGTDLRAGVLANAGSRVAFRLDHEDASVIAKRSGGKLSADDFSSLPPFDVYADLVADGAARGFASARTRPLGPAIRSVESVRSANRRAWGVPRGETEAHLRALLDGPASKESGAKPGGGFGVIPDAGGRT
jgi:energy-coupling factor transporter ATP-binding protein EcfA2